MLLGKVKSYLNRAVFVLAVFYFPLNSLAEIYRCVDAKGRPAFSNTPCPDDAVVGNSPAHTLWREMRVLVSEGQNITKLLNADAQSIVNCRRSSAKFLKKLEGVDNRLANLSPDTHKHLFKAMDYIKDCAQCRSAAYHDCHKATTALDDEMSVLMNQNKNPSARN
jgi:Domain of unknown function (DUF4124)